MYGILLGGAYGISTGLILYSIHDHMVGKHAGFILVLIWAIIGVFLSIAGVYVQYVKNAGDRESLRKRPVY